MAARRVNNSEMSEPDRRAATTPEGRENQLIDLAVSLAEKQLRNGTASSQVISHYLKAGSTREYIERRRLEMDIELMEAKREAMKSVERVEELYERAIVSMQTYQTGVVPDEIVEFYDG